MGLKVTVLDEATGVTLEHTLTNGEYALICSNPSFLASTRIIPEEAVTILTIRHARPTESNAGTSPN